MNDRQELMVMNIRKAIREMQEDINIIKECVEKDEKTFKEYQKHTKRWLAHMSRGEKLMKKLEGK